MMVQCTKSKEDDGSSSRIMGTGSVETGRQKNLTKIHYHIYLLHRPQCRAPT